MSQSPDLPEAMVLSYERRLPGDEMAWVVRWVGMWVALLGLAAVAGQLAVAWGGMLWWPVRAVGGLQQTAGICCGVAAIVIGLAMARQRRWACYASLALPVIPLLGTVLSVGEFGLESELIAVLSGVSGETLLAIVQFMILMTLSTRAEQAGVLQPQRRQTPGIGLTGSDITFLIQRVGWYLLAFPGIVILWLAAVPFLRSPASGPGGWWSGYSTVYVLSCGLCGVLGLLLVLQYRWALIGLAVLLPVQLVAIYVVTSLVPGAPMDLPAMIGGIVQTVGMVVLLVQLYRRARA